MENMNREELIIQTAAACPLTPDGVDLRSLPERMRPLLEERLPRDEKGSFLPPLRKEETTARADLSEWNGYCCRWLLDEYYPGRGPVPFKEELRDAVTFYLDVLNAVFDREKAELPHSKTRSLVHLNEDEWRGSDTQDEYALLLDCLRGRYLYAFMRLHQCVTGFKTLSHISGVSFISSYIARQLKHTSIKIDAALVSGAAILHDVGKYGCRSAEMRRVPYLHYYYTYQFAQRFGMPSMASIASAHSVWDLELENLSAESLILIYSDFRVKSERLEDGTEKVCFLTLKEAYSIILGKLDNLDEAKRKRYAKVYAKLKDFEDYLVSLGVSTDLEHGFCTPPSGTPYSLMNTEEMVQAFKYLAISQNLKVMYTTGHEASFISLLEDIRGEKDWRHVRAFLTVIGEYSGYLKQEQKLVILDFLYEMLSHQDGDIRRQAARISAAVMAGFDITFKKELPMGAEPPQIGQKMTDVWRQFLHRMLFPSHMVTEQHRRWIGYAMKSVVRSLLSLTEGAKRRDVLNVVLEHYKSFRWEGLTRFILLDCLAEIPFGLCSANQRKLLFRFDRWFLTSPEPEIRVSALRFLLCWMRQGCRPDEEMRTALKELTWSDSDPVCVRYLTSQVRNLAFGEEARIDDFDEKFLYLENQRAEIPWIYKLVNLEILQKKMNTEPDLLRVYQYASHLLNLLQFTPRVTNKLQAGENLVAIMPRLSEAQRFEIVLELVRALAMGQYSVSKYIPQFMGRIYVIMTPDERQALLSQFHELYGSTNPAVVILTLETVSVILQYLPGKHLPDSEKEELVGMLFAGTVHFNPEVSREAFYFLGEGLFASPRLTPERKKEYFTAMARKVLTFIRWDEEIPLWYYNAASLNHIYRFLSDYLQEHETIEFGRRAKIAFFPGTFDPFSLGHKAIVREIASMGFHVFLAVDEFSWSKSTQPYRVRRKIMVMSVADLNDVFLFPIEIPVNIACPDDLDRLRRCFPDEEVYIVAGSDVVENASAYRAEPTEHSVHSFPHIIFARNTEGESSSGECYEKLQSEVLYLKLPAYFENMSSTRIRSNVSANKDIADLVDPVVQNYIYENGIYTMEPMYKRAAMSRPVDSILRMDVDEELTAQIRSAFPEQMSRREALPDESPDGPADAEAIQAQAAGAIPAQSVGVHAEAPAGRSLHAVRDSALILRNEAQGDDICGAVFFHEPGERELLDSCKSLDLAEELRSTISGRTCIITDIFGLSDGIHDESFTALSELLAYCQENGFSHALCFNAGTYDELLRESGFIPFEPMPDCYLVDLRKPLVLFFDTPSFLKDQFSGEPEIREVLWECHRKLRRAVAGLFPGHLVLGLDSEIMNHRLSRLIIQSNPIAPVQYTKKLLGEKICVPYGKILKGVLIDNCVTKDLNTEKLYDIDMERFTIREFPQYAPLDVQIRTIKSFMRPVILVDDIYHKGYRFEAVQQVMRREGVQIDKLIVGVRSGRGNDLAHQLGEPLESVYFVPNMRSWLIESDLYPFIGGDGIRVKEQIHSSPSLPSANSILPYQFPSFIKGASMGAFYSMSAICLENAHSIFQVLERLYQKKYGRKLTMSRIGEVLAEPRHPDTCILDTTVVQESPSLLLEREIQKLNRLRHLLDGQFRM